MKSANTTNAAVAAIDSATNAIANPKRSTTKPPIRLLNAAPVPTASDIAPCARLKRNVGPGRVHGDHLSRKRQHGCIAEVKEHHGNEEDQQIAPLQYLSKRERRGFGLAVVDWVAASRVLVIDVAGPYQRD